MISTSKSSRRFGRLRGFCQYWASFVWKDGRNPKIYKPNGCRRFPFDVEEENPRRIVRWWMLLSLLARWSQGLCEGISVLRRQMLRTRSVQFARRHQGHWRPPGVLLRPRRRIPRAAAKAARIRRAVEEHHGPAAPRH